LKGSSLAFHGARFASPASNDIPPTNACSRAKGDLAVIFSKIVSEFGTLLRISE
jgi:hypothetical protein